MNDFCKFIDVLACNNICLIFDTQQVYKKKSSKTNSVADLEIQKGGFSHWRAKRARKFLGCHAHFWSRWKSELNSSKEL